MPQKVWIQRSIQMDVKLHFGAFSDKLLVLGGKVGPFLARMVLEIADNTFGWLVGIGLRMNCWGLGSSPLPFQRGHNGCDNPKGGQSNGSLGKQEGRSSSTG